MKNDQTLSKRLLTIAVPTFNRSVRLASNLEKILNEIKISKVEDKLALLVSDNNSTDDTEKVCTMFEAKYLNEGIDFKYFRNDSNLGFSSNVILSYFRAVSQYTLFFSDDDNLQSGFLNRLIEDINQYKFSVGLYNFIQPPYGEENLIIKDSKLISGQLALEELESLILWPKLSGLVLRNNQESGRFERFKNQIPPDNVVGHVLLSIDQIIQDPILYKSSSIAAYPDEDYRDHVNFVSYIGNYIRKDLEDYFVLNGITNKKLINAIKKIPNRNVVLYSLLSLSMYYKSETKLSKKMKNEVFQNIFIYLRGKKVSQSGLVLENPYKNLSKVRTITYLLYILCLAIWARITKKKLYLMNEAF